MYKKGLIIGRFQPFHQGHLFLVREALKQAESIIIGIGSTNSKDRKNNPFSYNQVKNNIQTILKQEAILGHVIQIFAIPDTPSDKVWLQDIRDRAQKFDVVISNNDWVTGICKHAGFKVIEPLFYKRHIYEGKKIRATMREKGEL